jgi:biopolymer transport protein ExbB
MEGIIEFLNTYKLVDIAIVGVGLFGMVILAERVKALYFDYVIDAETFTNQVISLINEDKIEQAITFCAANEKKPLAYVVKRVLEKSDRDEHAVNQSLDIASAEVGPKLVKSLGHLAMIANVVTLIGLLGTVTGLIMAFKAVSFADVSQKQTLLAQGISMAMSATALGLMTSIPIMFVYSFLHARQGRLFSDIDRSANKIMEALENRFYKPFSANNAYHSDMKKEVNPNGKATTRPTPPNIPKTKVS